MLGRAIREARLAANLTQQAVAERAKLSREYVNQVENDRKSPTVTVFIRICIAIGVKPSAILAAIE